VAKRLHGPVSGDTLTLHVAYIRWTRLFLLYHRRLLLVYLTRLVTHLGKESFRSSLLCWCTVSLFACV